MNAEQASAVGASRRTGSRPRGFGLAFLALGACVVLLGSLGVVLIDQHVNAQAARAVVETYLGALSAGDLAQARSQWGDLNESSGGWSLVANRDMQHVTLGHLAAYSGGATLVGFEFQQVRGLGLPLAEAKVTISVPGKGTTARLAVGLFRRGGRWLIYSIYPAARDTADETLPAQQGGAAADPRATPTPAIAREGAPAPDFELRGLQGERLGLSDFTGQPVVLAFWASWCKECRTELSMIQAAWQEGVAEPRFAALAINVQDDRATAQDSARDLGLTYPVALDRSGQVAGVYRVRGFPTSVFISPAGQIVSIHRGPLTSELLTSLLRQTTPTQTRDPSAQ